MTDPAKARTVAHFEGDRVTGLMAKPLEKKPQDPATRKLFGDGDRAVVSAGAANSDGEIGLSFGLVPRDQEGEHHQRGDRERDERQTTSHASGSTSFTPTPNTVWVRLECSGQRVQAATAVRSSSQLHSPAPVRPHQ